MSKKNRNKNAAVDQQFSPAARTGPVQLTAKPSVQSLEPTTMPDAPRLTRDQQRALWAYTKITSVPVDDRDNYETAVNAFGANILRSGLAAAMADLERRQGRATLLRQHLSTANIPGLTDVTSATLPDRVRALPVADYMLATREILQIVMWLKRAVQATFEEGTPNA